MDTSNSLLHVRVVDLLSSSVAEDKETANKCREVLSELLKKLVPVLHYVCVPRKFLLLAGEAKRTFHCIFMGSFQMPGRVGRHGSYINDRGNFFTEFPLDSGRLLRDGANDPPIMRNEGDKSWEFLFFDELIANLSGVFASALAKKEEYLKSIKQRNTMLEELLRVLRGSPCD